MAMLSPTRQARVCPCSPDSDVQLKWHEMPLKQLIHGAWLGAAVAITQMLPGVNGTSCSAYPACVTAGIKEGECCPNAEKVSLGCCDGFPKVVPQVQILLGSECEKFPACAKLNMTGGCCPTPDGVKLGCCLEI